MLFGRVPFHVSSSIKSSAISKQLGDLEFPHKEYSDEVLSLIRALLQKSEKQRLGTSSDNEVINHSWFSDVDFKKLFNKQILAPVVPQIECVRPDADPDTELPDCFQSFDKIRRKTSLDDPLAGFGFVETKFVETAFSDDYNEEDIDVLRPNHLDHSSGMIDRSNHISHCESEGANHPHQIKVAPKLNKKRPKKIHVTRSLPQIQEIIDVDLDDIEIQDPYELNL